MEGGDLICCNDLVGEFCSTLSEKIPSKPKNLMHWLFLMKMLQQLYQLQSSKSFSVNGFWVEHHLSIDRNRYQIRSIVLLPFPFLARLHFDLPAALSSVSLPLANFPRRTLPDGDTSYCQWTLDDYFQNIRGVGDDKVSVSVAIYLHLLIVLLTLFLSVSASP